MKEEYYLLVNGYPGQEYSHVRGHIVRPDMNSKLLNPEIGSAYSDLTISCQIDGNSERESYGWGYEYREPFSVDLNRADLMAKTLKSISKKMYNLTLKRGESRSFGEYVGRFCECLSIETICFYTGKCPNGSYGGSDFRYEELGWGVQSIDSIVSTFNKTMKE